MNTQTSQQISEQMQLSFAGVIKRGFVQALEERGSKPDITSQHEEIFKKLGLWLYGYTSKHGLILHGGIGSGKTTMARGLLSLYSEFSKISQNWRGQISDKYGGVVYYKYGYCMEKADIHDFASEDEYRACIEECDKLHRFENKLIGWVKDKSSFECRFFESRKIVRLTEEWGRKWMLHNFTEIPLLIIDGMGEPCEALSVKRDHQTIRPISEIIEQRNDEKLPTIITTNLNRKMLTERYSDYVISRLSEFAHWCSWDFENYREKKESL